MDKVCEAKGVCREAGGPGGPDKLSSLRNSHMTILHSSLHKYIHIVRAYNIE